MEAKLDQLRSLVEAADRDKVELLNQLEEEKRWVGGRTFSSSSSYDGSRDLGVWKHLWRSTQERRPDDCPCLTGKWKICSSVWKKRASPKGTWR